MTEWLEANDSTMTGSLPKIKYLEIDSESLTLLCFDTIPGTSVKYVLQQNKAAFVRLVGVSILQSGVSSFLAPSLRFVSSPSTEKILNFVVRLGNSSWTFSCCTLKLLIQHLVR